MKLTLKRFDELEWQSLLASLTVKDLFGTPKFLHTIEQTYDAAVVYQGVFRGDKPVLLVTYLERKKKIIFPNHYFFSFAKELPVDDEWTTVEAWDLLLHKITTSYQKVKLRLPIEVADLRPFSWNGFSHVLKNTYIKNLDLLDYHSNINRILAKDLPQVVFSADEELDAVFALHSDNLKRLLFKKSFIGKLELWLKNLEENGLIQIFSAVKENKVVASIIAMVDRANQKAYFPLISKPEAGLPKEISAKLYDYSFRELRKLGIEKVDLYGADMKSIARFKAKFKPSRAAFFEVEYHAGKQVMESLADEVKQKIKKILR